MSWRKVKLGELGEFRNGLNYSKANEGSGLKVISVKNFGDLRVPNFNELDEINPSCLNIQNSLLAAGDIIFVRSNGNKDLIGRSMFIEKAQENVSFSGFCIRFRNQSSLAHSKFLAYYFRSPLFRRTLSNLGGGTNINNLNQGVLGNFPILLPSLDQQETILSILSAYDDLIENNRKRIALLEQAARLLYREWFVHFRFPGHETAKIVDGLPEGWKTHLLGQVADFHLGKMLDQNKNKGDSLPYLANVNVRWGEFELSDLREMRLEERELQRFVLRNGDIVMCEGGEPGRCAIWRDQLPRMMFQKALHRIRPLKGMNSEYLYRTLSYQAKRGHLSGLFTGSTIKHLPKEKLALVTIVVPSQEVLDDFERIVTPMSHQAAELAKQSAKLTRARDLLLPRLMDGRIPV